jgi:hypothetical protein
VVEPGVVLTKENRTYCVSDLIERNSAVWLIPAGIYTLSKSLAEETKRQYPTLP